MRNGDRTEWCRWQSDPHGGLFGFDQSRPSVSKMSGELLATNWRSCLNMDVECAPSTTGTECGSFFRWLAYPHPQRTDHTPTMKRVTGLIGTLGRNAHQRRRVGPHPISATRRLVNSTLAPLLLDGCESYRKPVRSIGHDTGALAVRDVRQAGAYRRARLGHLGLSPERVRVEPGSGVTSVSIQGIISDAERQSKTAAIAR